MPSLASIAAVALGAAFGGVARFLIATFFAQRFGVGFPYGTFVINVTGSFFIGFVIELSQTRAFGVTPIVRLFLATGVLGGYTTFSSFSYETFTLASEGNRPLSLVYAGGSVIFGVAAYIAGTILARLLLRPARG